IGNGYERQVGVIIHPGDFTNPPATPATLLQTYERAIKHFISGCEDLVLANDSTHLLKSPRPFAPRLIIVVLLARNFDRNDRSFPPGKLLLLRTGGGRNYESQQRNRHD